MHGQPNFLLWRLYFFFQAEDGIRDLIVTGVQTCALPILSNATPALSRFRLLDGSVALTLHNTQISFGKQSVWLGPGEAGSLLFSNNAESIVMLKIESASPYHIPLVSSIFGPLRTEVFLGRLAG